jgi:hypothetical protein
MVVKKYYSACPRSQGLVSLRPCWIIIKFVSLNAGIDQTRACTIKLFTMLINTAAQHASVFVAVCHYHPTIIFPSKIREPRLELLTRLHCTDKILALTANISLGWKRKIVTNGLAYFTIKSITPVEVL